MPLEIEVKLRAPSLDAVRDVLRGSGATHTGLHHETNIFFDRPDRSLLAKDSGLRVRLARKDGETEPSALLTFKGPRQHSTLRPREAFDLTVSPAQDAIPMLKALGYEQVLSFEKRRDSWEFGGCKVELDTLPALGTFVEIEGPSEEQVIAVRERLGLDALEVVKPSYSAMMAQHVEQHHVPGREVKFTI